MTAKQDAKTTPGAKRASSKAKSRRARSQAKKSSPHPLPKDVSDAVLNRGQLCTALTTTEPTIDHLPAAYIQPYSG